MEIRGFADGDSAGIPKTPGLYAFYLDALGPARVGLLTKTHYPEEQLEKAKENTIIRVDKIMRFMRSLKATGAASSTAKSGMASTEFSIKIHECIPSSLLDDLRKMSVDDLLSYLRVVDYMPLFCQPIYVGITKNQTLYDRYQQHRIDYESDSTRSTFGSRLREAGFDWDEVLFACIKIDIGDKSADVLRVLERHLQALSKPILSLA